MRRTAAVLGTVACLTWPTNALAEEPTGGPDFCGPQHRVPVAGVIVYPLQQRAGRPVRYTISVLDGFNRVELTPSVRRVGSDVLVPLETRGATYDQQRSFAWTFVPEPRSLVSFTGRVYCGPGDLHIDLRSPERRIGFTARRLGR